MDQGLTGAILDGAQRRARRAEAHDGSSTKWSAPGESPRTPGIRGFAAWWSRRLTGRGGTS